MFYNPFEGFRDPNDPYGLLQLANAQVMPRPVPTTRFGPDGQPLPPDAPPPVAPLPSIAPRVPEAATTDALDYRREPFPPTSRKVPEVLTPTVGATDTRVAALPDTWQERLAKLAQSNELGGMVKAISAAFPAQKKKELQPFRVSGSGGGERGVRDLTGQGQQILSGLLKGRKAGALIGGDLGPRQRQPRTDDPFKNEQDRFDFRRRSKR